MDKTYSPLRANPASTLGARWKRQWPNFLYVVPYLLIFVVLIVIPLFMGFGLSLTRSDLFGFKAWAGFKNYTRLLADPIFRQTVWNTFYYVAFAVPVLTVLGLLLALGLNRPTKTATVLRTIFFSSTVLSVTVVTLVWRLVFLPDGGLLDLVAQPFGGNGAAWLNSQSLAKPAVAITTIWWCIGLPMVLFLAALQQVPKSLYEAAKLDGAGAWQTLRYITLPAVRRTTVLVIIIEVILQFQIFGQPQLMTQGGPNNASRPIVLFIYEAGWRQWDIGYAQAASQILFLMIMIAAMAQYYVSTRSEDT